ncbi:H-NS histone family protein [Crenobacter intestini]|uniref:H-NS histone family protein n=1 Tax=Crenobacter intestini TaxID=2563443 RepID=A0A4V4N724_9NEIS|nr:H-NS histone family protein [Crenobacter intestini]TIC78953.1 H-NS histone family protein [Crenobacter intestini]
MLPPDTPRTNEQIEVEIAKLQAELRERKQKERKDALVMIKPLIVQYQFTLKELGLDSGEAPAAMKTKATPGMTYQNPKNPDQIWKGHGRQPKWIKDELSAGKTMKDLEAKQS